MGRHVDRTGVLHDYRLRDTVKLQPSSRPMPRPVLTAVNILEKRRREDGGADLLGVLGSNHRNFQNLYDSMT